ncbi:MAG: hypothetical protein K2I87_06320, partial [Bacteroidales bacterium]|nr:hypothetical protein [Bacteroidales bacterium]
EAEYTFIITEDLELTANFEQNPSFTLAIHVNNSEWGYTYGEGTYYEGEEITIYASPNNGYHFVNWTKADGSVFSTEAECTFRITENLELTANFAPNGGVGNENHGNDHFAVYVQDRTICISENRGLVQVFNTAGQCIYNGSSVRIPVSHSGVYIVKVGARRYKVIVR